MKDYILVAAHDAPDEVKAEADFVCDGIDDEATIEEAVLAARERSIDMVKLSPGTFHGRMDSAFMVANRAEPNSDHGIQIQGAQRAEPAPLSADGER